MSQQWEIQTYITDDEACPFEEWLDTLAPLFQQRIDVRLDRVKLGNFGDHKSVGEGVYELRFTFGPGFRVYYGIVGKRIVLLLIGGSKKSQNKDIKTAQTFWKDYLDSQEHPDQGV
jgi:putative addiction module killer protein